MSSKDKNYLQLEQKSGTLISPEADLFCSFFCHPTAIDDSGPNESCIWKKNERGEGKNKILLIS